MDAGGNGLMAGVGGIDRSGCGMGAITTAERRLVWKTRGYGSAVCGCLIWINPVRLGFYLQGSFALTLRPIRL